MSNTPRKKLIEVALPLEAINKASAREKSIRHGHPSTLHLWWARRPLAACRAVLFGQLVDDPSAWPERFTGEERQEAERQRLFRIIEALVKWENSTNEEVLNAARWEIARSVAWGLGEEPPPPGNGKAILAYLQAKAPPVYDPFCGGGSIPLEAQRLGLRAYGSDLNPVAVLISKALVEIPPKFAGRPPVNPEAQASLHPVEEGEACATTSPPPLWGRDRVGGIAEHRRSGVPPPLAPPHKGEGNPVGTRGNGSRIPGTWTGKGAAGLAEDVRFYGKWMRDEAERRIGHLYPPVEVTPEAVRQQPALAKLKGQKLTVIAWLWARTVASPNPAAKGAHVPLVSSFMLSAKEGKQAWVVPVTDPGAPHGYRFEVHSGKLGKAEEEKAKAGTKTSRGSNFVCVLAGTPITPEHVKAEGKAGRMGARLMAIVAEGERGRVYLPPTAEHEAIAASAKPAWEPEGALPINPRWFSPPDYGMPDYRHLFTPRQLVALTTFSDLVGEARAQVLADARAARLPSGPRLAAAGTGAEAYADAVVTYLGFLISRLADRCSNICTLDLREGQGRKEGIRNVFSRQAIPMAWDYVEANPLSDIAASMETAIMRVADVLLRVPACGQGNIANADAAKNGFDHNIVFSTDPPYYDNIGYAELSDFFYAWLRPTLRTVHPRLLQWLATPKKEELVASPYRHEGKANAEVFFLEGMKQALSGIAGASADMPAAIYYAFKQSEVAKDGVSSTGWATFLQAVFDAGLTIDGTWPMRSELSNRMIASGTNALASSIVLVCRKRPADAPVTTRAAFLAALKRELPAALKLLQAGNIAPVDLAQASIGPGMGIFTRHAKVLEADDSAMTVKTALQLINAALDDYLSEQEGEYDAETRYAITWFETNGMEPAGYGDAETLAKARNVSVSGVRDSGLIESKAGKVRLKKRSDLPPGWQPADDKTPTVWECAQHLIRVLESDGESAAAQLLARLGPRADATRDLAYRLYQVCERKKWAEEARAYNGLVVAWPELQKLAAAHPAPEAQGVLGFGG